MKVTTMIKQTVLVTSSCALLFAGALSVRAAERMAAGEWDMKGLFEIDDASPAFRAITVETRVKTSSPVERVIEVARMTHRRCPIHATLARATVLSFKLFVNDVELPL